MKNASKLVAYSLPSVVLPSQANRRVLSGGSALSGRPDLLVVNNNLRLLTQAVRVLTKVQVKKVCMLLTCKSQC
jgi:hypothetical protein